MVVVILKIQRVSAIYRVSEKDFREECYKNSKKPWNRPTDNKTQLDMRVERRKLQAEIMELKNLLGKMKKLTGRPH